MHLGTPALLEFFRAHREEAALVLATVIDTEGSTYRKPGAMMLISRDGDFEGMISGGCLEGDLLEHAEEVFKRGGAKFVSYDMHANENLVWGLGLGCDGVIHLMLQRLDRDDGFGFLRQLEMDQSERYAAVLGLVIKAGEFAGAAEFGLLNQADISVGSSRVIDYIRAEISDWPAWRTIRVSIEGEVQAADLLLIHIPVQIRVLVCGAGPDAIPVARQLSNLDWDVHIADHRQSFARSDRFPKGCKVHLARPKELCNTFDLSEIDAAVVMSHHLENDAVYLRQLAEFDIPYIGTLGPAARRERLLKLADCSGQTVFGPVGLDIGAELPEAIALSLVAEIHAILNNRNGASLTQRARI